MHRASRSDRDAASGDEKKWFTVWLEHPNGFVTEHFCKARTGALASRIARLRVNSGVYDSSCGRCGAATIKSVASRTPPWYVSIGLPSAFGGLVIGYYVAGIICFLWVVSVAYALGTGIARQDGFLLMAGMVLVGTPVVLGIIGLIVFAIVHWRYTLRRYGPEHELLVAADQGDVECVKSLLLKNDAPLDIRRGAYSRSLRWHDNPELWRLFIESGVDPKEKIDVRCWPDAEPFDPADLAAARSTFADFIAEFGVTPTAH